MDPGKLGKFPLYERCRLRRFGSRGDYHGHGGQIWVWNSWWRSREVRVSTRNRRLHRGYKGRTRIKYQPPFLHWEKTRETLASVCKWERVFGIIADVDGVILLRLVFELSKCFCPLNINLEIQKEKNKVGTSVIKWGDNKMMWTTRTKMEWRKFQKRDNNTTTNNNEIGTQITNINAGSR